MESTGNQQWGKAPINPGMHRCFTVRFIHTRNRGQHRTVSVSTITTITYSRTSPRNRNHTGPNTLLFYWGMLYLAVNRGSLCSYSSLALQPTFWALLEQHPLIVLTLHITPTWHFTARVTLLWYLFLIAICFNLSFYLPHLVFLNYFYL